jgi:hypothetical protein
MAWRFALLVIFAARSWACMCAGNWPSVRHPREASGLMGRTASKTVGLWV